MWECELKAQLAENPEMASYFKDCKLHEPMTGREGEDLTYIVAYMIN